MEWQGFWYVTHTTNPPHQSNYALLLFKSAVSREHSNTTQTNHIKWNLAQKNFRPEFFLPKKIRPNFLVQKKSDPNIFGEKLIFDPIFFGKQIFDPKFFWAPNFFRPNFFCQQYFRSKLFWADKNFDHIFFGHIFFGDQHFLDDIFFHQKNFATKIWGNDQKQPNLIITRNGSTKTKVQQQNQLKIKDKAI